MALASESELGPRVTTGKCRIEFSCGGKAATEIMQPAGGRRRAEWGALTWNKDNMVNAATAFLFRVLRAVRCVC